MESTAPGWVCQHCCWTNMDKLIIREANYSRDEGLEKRKEKIYFGCWYPGEVTGSSLNNWPLHLQDEHLEIYRGIWGGGYVQESRQRAHDRRWGSICVQAMVWSGKGMCGVWSSRHSILIKAFSGLAIGIFLSLSMPQESAIRNNCWGL